MEPVRLSAQSDRDRDGGGGMSPASRLIAPVVLFGVEFRGAALWLRTEGGRPVEMRALGGYQVRSAALGLACDIEPASRASGYRWSRPAA